MSAVGASLRSSLLAVIFGDAPKGSIDDVVAWWAMHREVAAHHAAPADLALVAGFHADRPGWAFASGYQAALRALVPGLPSGHRVALAVTETGGNHPRAIATTLTDGPDGGRLDGTKSFVTLGAHADAILVVATRGLSDDGRPRLSLVEVPKDAAGLSLEALPLAPFVPEVPHAQATLTAVVVDAGAVLVGDGYADYVKPFRTVEDAHVHLAMVGWLIRLARIFDMDRARLHELTTLAGTLHHLCEADPKDALNHVLLAGALAHLRRFADDAEVWQGVDEDTRAIWQRDRAILKVAEKARKARLDKALLTLRR